MVCPIISSCGLNNLLPISHAIRALFLCGMLKEPLLYSGRFDIQNLCFVKFQVIFKSLVCLFWRGISFSLQNDFARFRYSSIVFVMSMFKNPIKRKSGRRHKNWCMPRVLSFLIRYFSNYYTLHRSDSLSCLCLRKNLCLNFPSFF